MLETSSDLQKLVLTSVINDPNLFGNIIDDLNSNFFSDVNFQFLYKILYKYYKQYSRVPTEQEMNFLINQNYNAGLGLGPLIDVVKDCELVYHSKPANPTFVVSAVETFIKRAQFERLLADAAQKFQSDKSYTIDGLMDEFLKTYNYQVTEVDCMRLDDFEKYTKIRKEIFGSIDDSKVVKSCIDSINKKLTYKGYKPTDLITVVAPPAVGKTTFLINEGLAASIQGFNVLHIYLGDMNEITAANRYMACLTGLPIDTFSLHPENYFNMIESNPQINYLKVFNRLYNVSYAPNEVSADKLRVIVSKLQSKYEVHFDLIIVDYADNLSQENEQMYQNGGEIYNKLKALAVNNRSVVLTASQPQRAYFSSEIIPFEGIAESAKKLHVVDVCLTMGKPSRGASIATMHLAKVREGDTGDIIRLGLDLAVSRIKEISESDYLSKKSELYSSDPVSKSVKPYSKEE